MLSRKQQAEVVELFKNRMSQRDIAALYGVSQKVISTVVIRNTEAIQ